MEPPIEEGKEVQDNKSRLTTAGLKLCCKFCLRSVPLSQAHGSVHHFEAAADFGCSRRGAFSSLCTQFNFACLLNILHCWLGVCRTAKVLQGQLHQDPRCAGMRHCQQEQEQRQVEYPAGRAGTGATVRAHDSSRWRHAHPPLCAACRPAPAWRYAVGVETSKRQLLHADHPLV